MSKKKNFRLIVDTYNFFYKSVNNKEANILKMFPSRITTIENFIIKFTEITKTPEIQADILEQFFEWSFNYWLDKKNSKYGNAGIQIEWIVSLASIERWKKANPKTMRYIMSKNIGKKVTYESRLKIDHKFWNETLTGLNDMEEFEKQRFLNTQKGFANCSISTTLYNHKSPNCLECKYSTRCKELLKKNYPKIYKKRGYE